MKPDSWGDRIRIISLDDMAEMQGYIFRLETLIHCVEQTIPGSRGFGLPRDYLDLPLVEAENLFAAELEEKVEIYIPEISISEIMAETNGLDGKLGMTVNVERRRGDD